MLRLLGSFKLNFQFERRLFDVYTAKERFLIGFRVIENFLIRNYL